MNLRNLKAIGFNVASRCEAYKPSDYPSVIEGVEVIDALMPVSKLTGHRTSPQALVGLLFDPQKARFVQSLLQELPYSGQPDDDGTFAELASRLDLGTPAERELFIKHLDCLADSLSVENRKSVEALKSSLSDDISFSKSDIPNVTE